MGNMASHVELICIGNELLIGKVVNTNASWLAQRITELGGRVGRIEVVGDNLDEIAESIRSAMARKPYLIITTGGLGPTYDDMTLEGVARALGLVLDDNAEALRMVTAKYASMSMELTPARHKMARLPKGAHALENPVGTAPGCLMESDGIKFICLPGVPSEMEAIFSHSVAPIVSEASGGLVYGEASIVVQGMPESALAPILDDVRKRHASAYFKSHPKMAEGVPLIEIHISARGKGIKDAEDIVRSSARDLKDALIPYGPKVMRESYNP
jgi:nicotinamide-nucleotide amidase